MTVTRSQREYSTVTRSSTTSITVEVAVTSQPLPTLGTVAAEEVEEHEGNISTRSIISYNEDEGDVTMLDGEGEDLGGQGMGITQC